MISRYCAIIGVTPRAGEAVSFVFGVSFCDVAELESGIETGLRKD